MSPRKMKHMPEGLNKDNYLERELPYPPTINHYYSRQPNGALYINAKGKAYRLAVKFNMHGAPKFKGKVKVHVDVYPPDKRKRDLDNINKCLFDSIQHAGIINDDFDINFISMERCEVFEGGKVFVTIEEYTKKTKKTDLTGGFGNTKLNSSVNGIYGKLNR